MSVGKKPFFIPLKAIYYDQFIDRSKTTEYRLHKGQWNAKNLYPGRQVVLSRGYGKQHRAVAFVTDFTVINGNDTQDPESIKQVYQTADVQIAAITLDLQYTIQFR